MAKRNRTTFQKHFKEQARQQKQQEKAARRLQAKQRRAAAESGKSDTSLDLTDVHPDSQPVPAPAEQHSDPVHSRPRPSVG